MATKKKKMYWKKDRSSAKMVMSYEAKQALAKKRKVNKVRENLDELAGLAEALERAEPVLKDAESPAAKYFEPIQTMPVAQMPQTQPFTVGFDITPEGHLSFNFDFHGFTV